MNINLEKLKASGFNVELSKDRKTLTIVPRTSSPTITDMLREVSGFLGFNESEEEQLFGSVHKIEVMSAIRKCSRW